MIRKHRKKLLTMFNIACVKNFPEAMPDLFGVADELDNPNSWVYRFSGGEGWARKHYKITTDFILKEIKKEGGENK